MCHKLHNVLSLILHKRYVCWHLEQDMFNLRQLLVFFGLGLLSLWFHVLCFIYCSSFLHVAMVLFNYFRFVCFNVPLLSFASLLNQTISLSIQMTSIDICPFLYVFHQLAHLSTSSLVYLFIFIAFFSLSCAMPRYK